MFAGLCICLDILLPSLFPFMALAGFITLAGYGKIISFPFRPITRWLLRLPDELGIAVVASMIGGFPTGARTLSAMVGAGQMRRQDAERMLAFCVNPGPAFVLVAVGQKMFGSPQIGWMLLAGQLASSLAIGAFVMRKGPAAAAVPIEPMRFSQALVTAVTDAGRAILAIFGYVLLFSAVFGLISPYLGASPWVRTMAGGLLEVTFGCAAASRLGGWIGFALAAFFIGFSGLSVICQVSSLMLSQKLAVPKIVLWRLLGGGLSAGFSVLFARLAKADINMLAVWSPAEPNTLLPVFSANRILGAACIMGMAVILLFGLIQRRPRHASAGQ
jgi:hypothetical protein